MYHLLFRRRFRSRLASSFFVPILAGATLRDRAVACLGAMAGIALTGFVCALAMGDGASLPLIVAPIGASAVLVFAVPASPLAQPWPVIGGNTISALVGIAVSRLVPDPMLAIGIAVGLAIAAMSLTRSLHPPGGAAALTAVIGGPAVLSAGFAFAFVPVALNSVLLVGLGWCFHQLSRHPYPHRATGTRVSERKSSDLSAQQRVGFKAEDIDAALADLGETFDIDRDDIERLLRRVELNALIRSHGALTCADIMSRDIVSTSPSATIGEAKALLLGKGIRALPVVDRENHLLGIVGLRELANASGSVGDAVSPASTSLPDKPALGLLEPLTNGRTHAVVIVDANGHLQGVVTQTDLLAALAKPLITAA